VLRTQKDFSHYPVLPLKNRLAGHACVPFDSPHGTFSARLGLFGGGSFAMAFMKGRKSNQPRSPGG
jgi:hypothetical protein